MSHFQKHIFKNFPHVWPERSGWEMPPLEGWSKQTNRGNKGRGCFIQNSQNPCIAPYPNPGMLVDLPGFWEFSLQLPLPNRANKQTSKQTEMKIRKLPTLDKSKVDQKCLLLRRGSKGAAESKKLILSHLAPSTNRKILNLHSHSILWIFHNCSL